ncbi:MAG: pyruvate formate lyase-activating protein [Ruminobacter sp.]|uniref:pyruvate formate-lyase-activating protein n=1 Tax=Ruminobacter sp. TaxID=2774296 RepID=UPI001B5DDA8C|nr:pyruvate formate-lyase-activating protein [Ruminobacter sp.]MBP3749233.1 pyruvate formate lyase-activating protein [Ruminobacter sp.]
MSPAENVNGSELTARIHSIETGGAVDGPGIRYIVFFQGCQFKCIYCHNRDTWDFKGGEEVTVKKLMDEIVTYAPFFRASGGGVTASGGEASMQAKFVAELFRQVHAAGFNTCLDTNGGIRNYNDDVRSLIEETDTFLLDLKAMNDDVHKELTGRSNKDTLAFARYLADNHKKMWIRLVVVPTYTDTEDNARKMGEFIKELGDAVERVELLPYHEMGKHKWAFFNDPYKLNDIHPPKADVMKHLKDILREYHQEVY